MKASIGTALPMAVCASEQIKLIGSLDGMFPDFGHHLEGEMGGLWLHPIKLLDGFWLHFYDPAADKAKAWLLADSFENRPEGNSFFYRAGLGHTPLRIDRHQLAPEGAQGVIITYVFHNTALAERLVHLKFLARVDLRPVWFSGHAGILDSPDTGEWDAGLQMYLAKDTGHEWHCAIAASLPPLNVLHGELPGPQGDGRGQESLRLDYALRLPPGETALAFYIAGSFVSREDCERVCSALRRGGGFREQKAAFMAAAIDRARLSGPPAALCEAFDWVKVNTQWLAQDAGPYGRGLTAGLPEYPWWFGCDSSYALQGLLALGDFALCRDTLSLLLRYSRQHNGNGRILHEITTFGHSAHPGNTQETAHFLVIVFEYFRYTGDLAFLREHFEDLRLGAEWLKAQDTDSDLFPSGYGIIEIVGLDSELIDTAVYTCLAYERFARVCALLGRAEEGRPWDALAKRLKEAINTRFFDEDEGLYCDTFTSYPEVANNKGRILGRLHESRASFASNHLDRLLDKKQLLGAAESGWLINYNWVICTPMEAGIADAEKAARALARLYTPEFVNEYGMFLNALDAHEVMTISTGALAVAQARYGETGRALALVEKILATLSRATPGCITEFSPDAGCFVQAWTVYAVMVPVIRWFFGVRPDAENGRLLISPRMPAAWDRAALEKIPVQGGEVSLSWHRAEGAQVLDIRGGGVLPVLVGLQPGCAWRVNGTFYAPSSETRLVPVSGN